MKHYLLLFAVIFGLSMHINAENVNITGTVESEDGTPQSSYEVFIMSADSAFNFFYSNIVFTNDDGHFADQIDLPGDLSQGEVSVSVMSCNEMLTISQYYNPSNFDLDFTFAICTDSTGGGGNDTIVDCTNFISYDVEDFNANFYGMVFPEDDNAVYNWSFGDGTSGTGMEISHEYANEGLFEVVLSTISGDDNCTATSYQFVIIGDDSTGWNDCINWFEYQVTDLSVSFEGWVTGDDGNANFTWDFGDSTTGEGSVISHDFIEEGIYTVTLTTTIGDYCNATTSQVVQLGGTSSGQTVYGSIFADNTPLDSGFALLFTIVNDSTGNDVYYDVFDESIVDSMGIYYFENVPVGEYLILAFPDELSNYFDTHFPTYYGDVIFWENATEVFLGNANNPYNINLVPATGANAGDGIINGDIVGDGFKSQLNDELISLFLIDDNNQALEIVYSATDNTFDFSNIEFGTYTVYAEITGLPTIPAVVTLTADNPSADITIQVNANGVTTGIKDIISTTISQVGNIYPNPVLDQAAFEISLKEKTTLNILIINQIGQIVQSKIINAHEGNSIIQIQTNRIPHGVYNLQIVSDDGATFNQKFIK